MRKLIIIPLLLFASLAFAQPGQTTPGSNAPRGAYNRLQVYWGSAFHDVVTKDSATLLYGRLSLGLNQFAATTSSQLAGVISDETGTGFLVFQNSPSIVTPNITTPRFASGATWSFGSFAITVNNPTLGANYTQTLQAKAGTFAYLDDISGSLDNQLSKTANYTILSTDFVAGKGPVIDLEVDCTAGNITITMLSAAAWQGKTIYITKIDASANTVTINTIGYGGGNTLAAIGSSRTFKSNGTTISNR